MSIIFAPPGSGKTTWLIKNNSYIEDADIVLKDYHSVDYESYNHNEEERRKHYLTIDKQLLNLRRDGRHILGSLFWEVEADIIVIIDSTEHKKRVDKRNDLEWSKVELVTSCLKNMAEKYNIPILNSFDDIIN